METISRPPTHPALVGLVDRFWVSARPTLPGPETVLPSGRAQLIVDGISGRARVVGPRTRSSVIQPSTFSAGIAFSGVGLSALSTMPASELLDELVDARHVLALGHWQRCLNEAEPAAILDRLEQEALVAHFRGGRDIAPQVVAAERRIRDGIWRGPAALGVDRRRFVPLFRDAVGLGPKQYQRISRFQHSLRAMRGKAPPPLATIAATYGYSDQAHLTRDFKELSGLTPSRVHGATSSAHNHVELEAPRKR